MESEPIGLAGNRFSILASKRTPLAWIYLLCSAFLNPLWTAVSELPVCMIKRGKRNVKYKFSPPSAIILSLKIFNAKIEFKESELPGDNYPDFNVDSLNEIYALL
jgi:hypothetical protein